MVENVQKSHCDMGIIYAVRYHNQPCRFFERRILWWILFWIVTDVFVEDPVAWLVSSGEDPRRFEAQPCRWEARSFYLYMMLNSD
jgi:hypothetical protein